MLAFDGGRMEELTTFLADRSNYKKIGKFTLFFVFCLDKFTFLY